MAEIDTAQQEAGEIQAAPKGAGLYLVRMSEEPVSRYTGGIAGLKATKPAKGRKLSPQDPDVIKYAAYLDSRHDAALAAAGGGKKVYDYRYVVNGFAAKLTAEQAERLRTVPGVVSIEKDEALRPDTVSTPGMLKLTGPGGLWEQVGGVDKAGEDIIIGVVDTGVWPEHPSFSDRTGSNNNGVDGKLSYQQIPGWNGKCVPGEDFNGSNCNQKLIGCQFWNAGYNEFSTAPMVPGEFLSCRDSDSHGTHTASTAGGNFGVEVVPGLKMSGMAPRARIAAYKVCWDDGDPVTGGCFQSDSAAAIDQAVIDGVDVINFSIGGTTTAFLNVVQVAFFNAAETGVFVATSAGNAGTVSSVAHPAPWLTTVAAANHDRHGEGTVVLGNNVTKTGVNIAAGTGAAMLPLIHASLAGVAVDPITKPEDRVGQPAFAERINLCFPNHLDPSKVIGRIVVCDRGTNARVEKGQVVKAAGGLGMILANKTAATETLNPDVHALPAIHVDDSPLVNPTGVRAYSMTKGATARINDGAVIGIKDFVPTIASFSSRGPSLATNGDILKPDVTAPGVDVIAGTSPAGNGGSLWGAFQGTSMASPHVAGLGALLKGKYPQWSPMMIKSALMTTAGDLTSPTPFNQGAGHVRPNLATNPGLVYDSNANDWIKFICGTGQLTGEACAGGSIDPSNLNVASIAIGDVFGAQTVRRSVTNVGPATATYKATLPTIEGFDITVVPSELTLNPGETRSYDVTFVKNNVNGRVNRNAAGVITSLGISLLNTYGTASITWANVAGPQIVRSPVVVRPQAASLPSALTLKTDAVTSTASTTLPVKFGYNGSFIRAQGAAAAPVAMAPATVSEDDKDTFDTTKPDEAKGVTTHDIAVPAASTLGLYLRIAVVATDDDPNTAAKDDLDLYLYRVTKTTVTNLTTGASTVTETKSLLASGATSSTFDRINLLNPSVQPTDNTTVNNTTKLQTRTETKNVLYVHGFNTDGGSTTYTLNTWIARAGAQVAEAPAVGGTTRPVNVSYPSLTAGTKYLSVVQWFTQPWSSFLVGGNPIGNTSEIARTVVEIE